MKPQRTLLIDLENPRDALLETGLVLADTLVRQSGDDGEPYLIDNCKIWRKPEGINIRDRRDRAALVREIADHRPSLVCIGPWYKMQRAEDRENWESSALAALSVLDRLRVKYGFALVIEAHSPVAPPGVKRPLRPMGSAYLSAWPELGIGLRREEEGTTLNVEWWRGARLKQNDRVLRMQYRIFREGDVRPGFAGEQDIKFCLYVHQLRTNVSPGPNVHALTPFRSVSLHFHSEYPTAALPRIEPPFLQYWPDRERVVSNNQHTSIVEFVGDRSKYSKTIQYPAI